MSTTASADTAPGADTDNKREPEQEPAPPPQVGALMKHGKRVGRVMDVRVQTVYLRPVGGGTEWTAKPEELVPASTSDLLSPRVAEANKRSRGEL
jgi:hypothetical protein